MADEDTAAEKQEGAEEVPQESIPPEDAPAAEDESAAAEPKDASDAAAEGVSAPETGAGGGAGAPTEGAAEGEAEVKPFKPNPWKKIKPPPIIYGGLDGPDAEYIKLISSDAYEFVIKRAQVLLSGTIKAILSKPSEDGEVCHSLRFDNIPSHIMVCVCCYFTYRSVSLQEGPPYSPYPVDPKIALNVLMVANFLQI